MFVNDSLGGEEDHMHSLYSAKKLPAATLKLLLPVCLAALMLVALAAHAQQHKVKTKNAARAPLANKKYKYKRRDTVAKMELYKLDTLRNPVPLARTSFHDKVDQAQMAIDRMDGRPDTVVSFKRDTSWTAILSQSFLDDVDAMQVMIENMPANGRDEVSDNQQKIRYLRALEAMLQLYRDDRKPDPQYYANLVANMNSLLIAVNENTQHEFAHMHADIYTLDNSKALFDSRPDLRWFLYIKVGKQYPVRIARRLNEYADQDFAGDIIADAAPLDPELIYYYAISSVLPLKQAVYHTDDSLVRCIRNIVAYSRAPLKALSFLPDLYHARKTIAEIDAITISPINTFQNLVRLRQESDSLARRTYTNDLTDRSLNYVRKLDELHEEADQARFRVIDSLPATSLYYILVSGQDEIYTSSFVGTFRRMTERMPPLSGMQFMEALHYDHFRTFIRMCAGYNTLSAFLATMDDNARNELMTRFMAGLGNGPDDDLDDAVDVANAFGSITDDNLMTFLQKKVKENLNQARADNSRKGVAVYSILSKLINGGNVTGADLRAEATAGRLNIEPINKVPFKYLVSDSGRVYQQVFFYGDKDGRDAYESFMDEFKKDKNWNIQNGLYWTTISSVQGKKITLYANLPLKEPEDENAINKLTQYLDSLNIRPAIMIHRGHSYHLPVTIAKLAPTVRIVVLGSCGGYHNLAAVLDRSPDAHIISSKQTGVRAVNEPIIKAINQALLAGADINWINMWHDLGEQFKKNPEVLEKFNDYVPPHKNLGAIFIKAYRKLNPAVEVTD